MFSFHKPRVYRSAEGCCICRAKSSSSRFTDSSKYEHDSMKCFDLQQARHGEICNACVLLVKRFKRLPTGSTRNWGHVVDARAGPGCKTNNKTKKSVEDKETKKNAKSLSLSERFSKILKKVKKNSSLRKTPSKKINVAAQANGSRKSALKLGNALDMPAAANMTRLQTENMAKMTALQMQQQSNYTKLHLLLGSQKRKSFVPKKKRKCGPIESFHPDEGDGDDDANFWCRRKICCGTVYECQSFGQTIIIDLNQFKPCEQHRSNSIAVPQNNVSQKPNTMIAQVDSSKSQYVSPPILKKHHLFLKRQSDCLVLQNNQETLLNNNGNISKCTTNAKLKLKTVDLPINSLTCINQKQLCPTITVAPSWPIAHTAVVAKPMLPSLNATTKFSDNSSDSGFDENTHERKSLSPLQCIDIKKKLLNSNNVRTMFLASGVQVKGQQQNLILTGNEVAAKIIHKHKEDNAVVSAVAFNKPLAESTFLNAETKVQNNAIKITRIHSDVSAADAKLVQPTAIAMTPMHNVTITPTFRSNSNANLSQHNFHSAAPLTLDQNLIAQVSATNMAQNIIIIKTTAGGVTGTGAATTMSTALQHANKPHGNNVELTINSALKIASATV